MKFCIITSRTLTIKWFREDLVSALAKDGHEVVVFGDEVSEAWDKYFTNMEIRYLTYKVARTGTNPVEDYGTLKSLTALLRQERPDIVFTYQAKANIYGCLAARRAGVKKIFASVEGLGSILSGANDIKTQIFRWILLNEYKVAFKDISGVFFVNNDDVDFFITHGIIDQKKAIFTDGVGVNLRTFSPTELPEYPPYFLFVGRIIREKGVLEFAEAAKIIRSEGINAEFHIVGPFDENPSAIRYEELSEYIESNFVIYHGFAHDVRPYLSESHVLVLPSYYAEGLPKSVMEAMAMGRAVITTDNVGCKDIVETGVNGLLVPSRDSEALASAMRTLSVSFDLCKSMGRAGRQIAERRFNVDAINDRIRSYMGIEGEVQ